MSVKIVVNRQEPSVDFLSVHLGEFFNDTDGALCIKVAPDQFFDLQNKLRLSVTYQRYVVPVDVEIHVKPAGNGE